MSSISENYKPYRWFFTSTNKLVIGGKSAEQNDLLLKSLKKESLDYLIMHTSSPGSPFSVILSPALSLTGQDIEEAAIFTGFFSRAWKLGKREVIVDIFYLSQLSKEKKMKTGTWGVKGKVQRKKVILELALTRQKGILRAVPIPTIKYKKDIILLIKPGKIPKEEMLPKIQVEISNHLKQDELLAALPAGGVSIKR